MPDTIPQHFTTEFSTNWIHRTQQQKSRLDAYVESESFTGERKRYDRIAASTSRTRTERSGDTPVGTQDMDFRWAYRVLKDIPAKLLDPSDAMNLGALVLPNSDMIKANSMEYNRSCDQITLAAALGIGLRLWIAGLLLWFVGHMAAVWAAKRDPDFVEVVRRHLRIPGHLNT